MQYFLNSNFSIRVTIMSNDIEKANFFLETEEYDKAEEIFSQVFDANSKSPEAIKGLVKCKVAQSNFENGQIKATIVYLNKINAQDFDLEEREEFIVKIFELTKEYFKRLNKKFREEANELTKRPALDGQLYAIKQLSDTTDYLGFLNTHSNKFEMGIELVSKLYDLTKYKENTAFKILSLHDIVLLSIKETPQMTGKTLLNAGALSKLKESRTKWFELSGDNKSKIIIDPSDSSGCLVLIAALSGLLGTFSFMIFVLL